ncbi:830_t:CDS:2 [Dentiscutata erythropus]|uniref:830_t:CDS:1 n=1 Tax=Dentiscutata erythropus TaxID=1348616 RepID=A0A9N9CXT1_9GLOM|nr:830_t:CDS:2 [Dentiscutata erythropus]
MIDKNEELNMRDSKNNKVELLDARLSNILNRGSNLSTGEISFLESCNNRIGVSDDEHDTHILSRICLKQECKPS